ncbi:MAG: helix-turn-helix transcriptional regulator [Fibrobacteres bacterium]|nr:helix-turn-helix transcriptional regulator [Fibrobacterota bacterium]
MHDKSATLIGGRVLWANFREAGRAYRYNNTSAANGILLIASGEAEFLINNICHKMTPGRIALLSKGDSIEITATPQKPFSFFVINFTIFDWDGHAKVLQELGLPSSGTLKHKSAAAKTTKEIVELFRSGTQYKTSRLSAKLIMLIEHIKKELSETPADKNNECDPVHKSIIKVIDYIYSNLNRKIILKDLAKCACLDESYFTRLFHSTTGESPMEFIRRLKIERSKTVLVNSDLTILQVSSMFGFENQSHYSRQFKEYTGKSPLNYIRCIRGR